MRPSWDEYYMEMIEVIKKRSTCLRRQVGAIIVKDKRIISTGYNGSPMNTKHCEEVGCLREQLKIPSGERHELCRAIHAEQNALVQAAYSGTSVKDAVMYITTQPCSLCAKMLINAGISKVVYKGDYPDEMAMEMLKEAGVRIVKVEG
ncbi:MAG: dCMP deaminase family protein [Bacillota bacterium]